MNLFSLLINKKHPIFPQKTYKSCGRKKPVSNGWIKKDLAKPCMFHKLTVVSLSMKMVLQSAIFKNKKTDRHAKRIDFITNAEEHTKKKEISLPVISTIKPACRTVITSLPWAETESIKTQYTGGRSFFLFIGNIGEQHHLVELLKAFSSFKKWQQSNMQLVIAGYTTAFTDRFE